MKSIVENWDQLLKKDFLTIKLNIFFFRIECNNQEYIHLSNQLNSLDHFVELSKYYKNNLKFQNKMFRSQFKVIWLISNYRRTVQWLISCK